jgi:hypothetical protein
MLCYCTPPPTGRDVNDGSIPSCERPLVARLRLGTRDGKRRDVSQEKLFCCRLGAEVELSVVRVVKAEAKTETETAAKAAAETAAEAAAEDSY